MFFLLGPVNQSPSGHIIVLFIEDQIMPSPKNIFFYIHTFYFPQDFPELSV